MTRKIAWLTTLAVVLPSVTLRAAGSKSESGSAPVTPNYLSAGQVLAEVVKADDSKSGPTLTIKVHNFHLTRSRSRTRVVDTPMTVKLPFAGDAQVRTDEMPQKPKSADGTPQFYTPDEMKKLKGNQRYPGWEKSLGDLRAGMKVEVHLMRDPQAPPMKPQDYYIDYVMIRKSK